MNKKTMIILGIAIVAVLAVVIAFMFGTKSNEIELTLDNYTDYLKITSYESKSGELIKVKKPFWLG